MTENEREVDVGNEHKRAKIFLETKQEVHIATKSGKFYNGVIIEVLAEVFTLNDNFLGKYPIFFSELDKPIEPRRKE